VIENRLGRLVGFVPAAHQYSLQLTDLRYNGARECSKGALHHIARRNYLVGPNWADGMFLDCIREDCYWIFSSTTTGGRHEFPWP
jgi:hypothetical protein